MYIKNRVAYDETIKTTLATELYTEMNEVKRSRYRVLNTMANASWDLPERPAVMAVSIVQ